MSLVPYAGKDRTEIQVAAYRWPGMVDDKMARQKVVATQRPSRALPKPVKLAPKEVRTCGLAILRSRGMPDWARQIVETTASAHGVTVAEIAGVRKSDRIVKARNEATYRIKERKPELSSPMIGKWFARHHTSVLHSIAWHQEATGEPALVGYELNRVRKRVVAYRAKQKSKMKDVSK